MTNDVDILALAVGDISGAAMECNLSINIWEACKIGYLLAKVGVRPVLELDAGERASELAAAGNPGDGAALIEEVGGVVQLDALLLNHAYPEHLPLLLIWDELGWQHLSWHIMGLCQPQPQNPGTLRDHEYCAILFAVAWKAGAFQETQRANKSNGTFALLQMS